MISALKSYSRGLAYAMLPAIVFIYLLLPMPLHAQDDGPETNGAVYTAIINNGIPAKVGAKSPALLENFYRTFGYRRIWTDELTPKTITLDLIDAITHAEAHGLSPEDYNLKKMEDMLSTLVLNKWRGTPGPASLAMELEVLATDSFLSYGADMLIGRARPANLSEPLRREDVRTEIMGMLYHTMSSGDIGNSLDGLAPAYYEYEKLLGALEQYRTYQRKGGWAYVKGPLKEGRKSQSVIALRERLVMTGDMEHQEAVDPALFDNIVKQGVIRYQRRNGLPATGYVGKMTLDSLNTPVEARVRTIKLNMERLRWMPVYTASSLIIVNLTDFSLRLIHGRKTELSMRVIIGKQYNTTPSFTTKVTAIELNPTWNIPSSIAREELLPIIKANPEYLTQRGIKLYANASYKGRTVDPATVNWDRMSEKNFPYWLKRASGNGNPLGKIKFIMPNEFSIYLHDTPKGSLFDRAVRTFSHGCIRLEDPLKLASSLLRDNKTWDMNKLKRITQNGKRKSIILDDPVMVQVVYRTAWVDDNGRVQFRSDIYKRDKELNRLMNSSDGRPLETILKTP